MRPAAQWLSFASPKESHQRKGNPAVCVPSLRCGQPAVLSGGVRRRTHFAPLALRSNNCDESVHEACVSCGTHATPPAALLGAYRGDRGETSIRAIASLRCARPHLAGASAPRCAIWAERSNGPCGSSEVGCSAVQPLLAAPAAGRLRGERMCRRTHPPRSLARRSCLNEARQRAVSSAAHPATAPTEVCPVAQRRGRRLGVAFLLGTFLWRSKEQVPRPPGRLPASAFNKGTHPDQRQGLR